MSAHDGEAPDVDPVTGYETTGHDWNGIKELNTPFPIFVITILGLTVVYSIIAWLLLPAWPTGRDYTRGLLGAVPRLDVQAENLATIAGNPPNLAELPPCCPFAPRCHEVLARCHHEMPLPETSANGHRRACWRPIAEAEA